MTATRLVAIVVVSLAACGEDSDRPDEAVRICEEYADVVASAFASCGVGTYEENFQAFEDALPGGDCDAADGIMDAALLESECFRFFREAECELLSGPDVEDHVPASCRGQVLFEM